MAKLNELAHAWLSDELAPDWRPRSHEQDQAILDKLELTGNCGGVLIEIARNHRPRAPLPAGPASREGADAQPLLRS